MIIDQLSYIIIYTIIIIITNDNNNNYNNKRPVSRRPRAIVEPRHRCERLEQRVDNKIL